MPSPQYGCCFSALGPKFKPFRISKYATFRKNLSFVPIFLHGIVGTYQIYYEINC